MKKPTLVLILVAGAAAAALFLNLGNLPRDRVQPSSAPYGRETRQDAEPKRVGDRALAEAFEKRERHVIIEGRGIVTKILKDDNDGGRHQRFIVRLASGQTLLIAHNIDLAPRVASLKTGDSAAFRGEYEWNAAGGVIHWTHADPDGRHPAGWIEHRGALYQ